MYPFNSMGQLAKRVKSYIKKGCQVRLDVLQHLSDLRESVPQSVDEPPQLKTT